MPRTPRPQRACPECGKRITQTARFCPSCGAKAEPQASDRSRDASDEASNDKGRNLEGSQIQRHAGRCDRPSRSSQALDRE